MRRHVLPTDKPSSCSGRRSVSRGTERPIWVLDTETTGFSSVWGRIVEIAVLCYLPARTEPESWLVNPGIPVPPQAVAVHGLTNAVLDSAGSFKQVWPLVLRAVEGDKKTGSLPPIVVAHNARFDRSFIEAEAERAGFGAPRWDWACSLKVTRALWSWTPHKLPNILETLGLPTFTAHRARGDILALAGVLDVASVVLRVKSEASDDPVSASTQSSDNDVVAVLMEALVSSCTQGGAIFSQTTASPVRPPEKTATNRSRPTPSRRRTMPIPVPSQPANAVMKDLEVTRTSDLPTSPSMQPSAPLLAKSRVLERNMDCGESPSGVGGRSSLDVLDTDKRPKKSPGIRCTTDALGRPSPDKKVSVSHQVLESSRARVAENPDARPGNTVAESKAVTQDGPGGFIFVLDTLTWHASRLCEGVAAANLFAVHDKFAERGNHCKKCMAFSFDESRKDNRSAVYGSSSAQVEKSRFQTGGSVPLSVVSNPESHGSESRTRPLRSAEKRRIQHVTRVSSSGEQDCEEIGRTQKSTVDDIEAGLEKVQLKDGS